MATPTSSKAHAMRMKMRQHAHLQAVRITFCLILSPEEEHLVVASACQADFNTCDATMSTIATQHSRRHFRSARQGSGRAEAMVCGRSARCTGIGSHGREQGSGIAITNSNGASVDDHRRAKHLHHRREGEWISVKIERSRACVGFWGLLWVSIDLFQHQWTWGAAPRRLP